MEKIIKYSIASAIAVLILFLGYSLLFSGESEEEAAAAQKAKEAQQLGFLLGGGGSADTSGQEKGSIFESDFYQSGKIEYEEKHLDDDADIDATNPVNPQTGKPYTDEAMAQFEEIKKKFPTNDLIPSKMTPEMKAAKKEQDERLAAANRAVFQKTASVDDYKIMYDAKVKQAYDRLEIIEYLINIKGMAAEDSEDAAKVKNIYDSIKTDYERLQKERETVFAEQNIPVYEPENIGKR